MQNSLLSQYRGLIFAALATALVVLIAATLWFFLTFRLTATEPSNTVAYTITQITFTFSKDLSNKTLEGISTTPATNGAFVIDKNRLIFRPTDTLKKGTLTFSFSDITAENGSVIKSLEKVFAVEYVEYNDLSEEEQQRQVSESGGGQDNFDILNGYLPHAAYNYTLDYIEPLPDDKKLTLVIDVYGKSSDESNEVFVARVEQARRDMLTYLDTHKGKNSLDDFNLIYNNDYLSRYNSSQQSNTDNEDL